MNLFTMEGANLFAGDHNPRLSNHLSIQSVKLPGLEENMTEHNAGGARVGTEIDTHIMRLEATFNLAGWNQHVMTLIGESRRNRQVFTIYGAIRDRRKGNLLQGKAIIQGRLARVNPTEYRRGDLQGEEYRIGAIVHYELYLQQEEIYFWDFFTSELRVGGFDVNADLNTVLAIPAAGAENRIDTTTADGVITV